MVFPLNKYKWNTNDHNIYKTKKMHWYAVGWVIPVEPRPFGSITNNQSADNIIDSGSFVTFCNKIKTYLHENTISTDMVITQIQIQKNKEVKIQCLSHKYKYKTKYKYKIRKYKDSKSRAGSVNGPRGKSGYYSNPC